MRKAQLLPLIALILTASWSAQAATIEYAVSQIGTTGNGDRFRYEYSLSNQTISVGQGFSVFFDVNRFSDIQAVSSPSDWDILVLQPDPFLPDDGVFDALALAPSLGDSPFVVDATWMGDPELMPGAQPFEIYDTDFSVVSSGETILRGGNSTPPIPEPSGAALFLVGCALVQCSLRSKSR